MDSSDREVNGLVVMKEKERRVGNKVLKVLSTGDGYHRSDWGVFVDAITMGKERKGRKCVVRENFVCRYGCEMINGVR